MEQGTTIKHVISKGRPKSWSKGRQVAEVVYLTFLGKHNGKARYSSKTKHELI